jgi:hypothetical protein
MCVVVLLTAAHVVFEQFVWVLSQCGSTAAWHALVLNISVKQSEPARSSSYNGLLSATAMPWCKHCQAVLSGTTRGSTLSMSCLHKLYAACKALDALSCCC